ncbi:hypothetical protein [Leyella stercorea]|uniref:hypothetical protein n=1 Tax=Leyella stercorea TaxID=363265 RepID=UPI002431994F|nr:hypothetical protein [Leyella stercorea]
MFLLFGRFGWLGNDVSIGRCRCSYRSAQMSVSVGADVRIGRCGCPYRSTQMSVSVDADARIDRRGWF